MKRYIVASDENSKSLGAYSIEEIAALLNAHKITEKFVVTECNPDIRSYAQLIKSPEAKRATVAQVLEEIYKDKPIVTVFLKDSETNELLLGRRFYSKELPWYVAHKAAENYFDQQLDNLSKISSKKFFLYFTSDKCAPSFITFTFKAESRTFKKGITGSRHEPFEETFPYQFVDETISQEVESPDEFPSVPHEQEPPGYDPTAPLPRH